MLTLSLLAASPRASEEPCWCSGTVTQPPLVLHTKEELRASECDNRTAAA